MQIHSPAVLSPRCVNLRHAALACWLPIALLAFQSAAAQDGREQLRFTIEVDLGKERGQSFGSLFEARDANGRLVAGAGFQDVYNTRFRTDRHTLQFFVRPESRDEQFTLERLPHPDLDCGVYLFDLDEQLYAWSSVRGNSVRRWDAESGEWVNELPPGVESLATGDGACRVGDGILVFSGNAAAYDGRQILAPPETGQRYNFYYALGHLCFYYYNGDEAHPACDVYACPWTPGEGPINLDDAHAVRVKFGREVPFAWGQWEDQIVTVSNWGGIYVFEAGVWKTTLEASEKSSYQVYSMLRWYDRALLAQYPSGHVFQYQGEEAVEIEGWPPRLPGVSPSARECQSLSIYRGELFAGVWPWAEVWRYDRDVEQWHSLGRMFTHPEITDETVHPYEAEAERFNLVLNHWGQRATSMVPLGDALYIGTSTKGTSEWDERYDFLTEDQRREYGSVLRLTMPGNLAAQIEWKDGPIQLDFIARADGLEIQQDGRTLARSNFNETVELATDDLTLNWGDGIFGPLRGDMTEHEFKVGD
ncbi:MAG: hypothetical protein DWQ34_28700 [Planctomycetota bacterium]|nr:MAG: hypothetical protein DWQ29_20985 [Planctomycetota bacterium]REJ85590.1 MAG: hypothetical protein DWQ34_28700 [Planctomycetota bacterium]REK31876.1 MAG: hypothetical protein DWQ45_18265 [Planctomycetota bacterium]